jgi:hypothetical protein
MIINGLKKAIRAGVEWLHEDHNKNLGINNTFRISKAINRLALARAWRRYRRAYLQEFQELLAENGPIGTLPQNILRDGWAIDRSGSLPHLQELLQQVGPIIEERGGRKHEPDREHKPFFFSMYQEGDIEKNPAFLDFALSSEVMATVAHQIGTVPILARSTPPGVRLMESNEAFNRNPPGTLVESQFYHLDLHDRPVVYVIVLLKDTTTESGPWHFLPASSSTRARRLLGYQARGAPYRVTDERMYSVVDPSEVITFTGKAGDVLFIESSSCFHFGSRNSVNPRYQMMYAFTTPCSGHLKDWIVYGMRPEAKPGDSRLRRMVLRR